MSEKMQKGAFALLDCLGFKGIWTRHDSEKVVEKLIGIEKLAEKACSPSISHFASIQSHLIVAKAKLLSDTVAVSVKFRDPEAYSDENNPYLVSALCYLVEQINSYFLDREPHLLLRGCITFDDHLVEQNFIIGPAVDRAAEYEKLPNGAFIWLDPSASLLYSQFEQTIASVFENEYVEHRVRELLSNSTMPPHMGLGIAAYKAVGKPPPIVVSAFRMPIKSGESISAMVLNPLARESHPDARKQLQALYMKEMSSTRLDVIIKRQNTERFLAECDRITEDYFAMLTSELNRLQAAEAKGSAS